MTSASVGADVPVLDIDACALNAAWRRSPLGFRHRLAGHPLLSPDALAGLAERVPPSLIEHHVAELPLVLPEGNPRRLRQAPGEVARGIAGNGCWMMYSLRRTEPYDALLSDVGKAVRAVAAVEQSAPDQGTATIFLASPGASVPVHFDRHHNFLLHASGTKTVTVGAFADPRDAQREIERNFSPERHNAHRVPEESRPFVLRPGDGLYIPPYTFHWVTGGPDVAVSLSCSFRTLASVRRESVHQCNAGLRRLGLEPRPPEVRALQDYAKVALLNSGNRVRDAWRGCRRR
ncbi:MAG: JmjC domain-containing protein [Candidatus Dormibacteria bacterium]